MQRKYLSKALGLSLLVTMALMAVGVGTAQAKYELRRNGASVSSLSLTSTLLLTELVAENGLRLHCTGGTSTTKLSGGGTASLVGTTLANYSGCVWKGSEKTCTIFNQEVGKIHTGYSAFFSMGINSDYWQDAVIDFTPIYTIGAFCTIPEEEAISGFIKVEYLSSETDATVHTVHIVDDWLFLGESGATLSSTADTQEATGATWAIRLTGL